ncbi:aminotransferase class V-fold PLP-dependent enzyme [Saccharothrix australiensis]|uniref:aminotransferase class V-fold PLP-dependent enzyme n=1 Tax=Saccharothrix australiensis TaxID=2072 RepID=UPI000EAEB3BA|nr:aminotransferase class V-fold PLP-dependent enzyme [Saccharothrix australiensis]
MRIPSSYLLQFQEPVGYLDFARFGPPSHAVVEETTRLLERSASAGPSTVDELMRWEDRARAAAARLCGHDVDHVALVPNTSTGLFQVALGLAGEVAVSPAEFPANTYPWVRAGRARVRRLPPGPVTPDVVAGALTADVTALAVSAVDFRTGYRADLAALRDVVGDRLLVVDGIQGFGVVDEPWAAADVLVVGGQKWVRAGWSTGFLALSDRALERLDPVVSGWTGAVDAGLFDDSVHPVAPGAAGWSITNLSPVAAGAFATALELVELAGVPALGARVVRRADELAEAVRSVGGVVVSEQVRRAGIVAFALPDVSAAVVGEALADGGVTATVRTGHVRLSPHASTTAEAVERFAGVLRRLRGAGGVGRDGGFAVEGRPVEERPVGERPVEKRAVEERAVGGRVAGDRAVQERAVPTDVRALRRLLVERAIAAVGVPVELMKKSHKSRVVRDLDAAGLFLIRDSVDHLAGELGVTRYTIYNYLNEVRARDPE